MTDHLQHRCYHCDRVATRNFDGYNLCIIHYDAMWKELPKLPEVKVSVREITNSENKL